MTLVPASSHGGALPSQWTVGAGGTLTIQSDDDQPELILKQGPNQSGENPILAMQDKNGGVLSQVYDGRFSAVDGYFTTAAADAAHWAVNGQFSAAAAAGNAGPALFGIAGLALAWAIDSFGAEKFAAVPIAPTDASVAASERDHYYSDTPNAPKLLTKQRDAAGTLFSGYSVGSALKTSGALSTVAPVSGTAFQLYLASDAFLVVPVTFNPGAATAATCTVALSPDNVTFSTLGIETEPAGVAFDGTIHLISIRVPAAWYVKLTVVNATLGTGSYY